MCSHIGLGYASGWWRTGQTFAQLVEESFGHIEHHHFDHLHHASFQPSYVPADNALPLYSGTLIFHECLTWKFVQYINHHITPRPSFQPHFSSGHIQIRHTEANPVVLVTSLECVTHCVEVPLSGPKHRQVCLTHCLQASHQNLLVKYNRIITERLKKVFTYILFMLVICEGFRKGLQVNN